MMRRFIHFILSIVVLGCGSFSVHAQNFIKVGAGFSFGKDKEFIQSFTVDLNRTEEVKEKAASHYFLYTKSSFYIIPTVDINIGETITASENNIITQVSFGKKVYDGKKNGAKQYWRVYFEGSPVYNADKEFEERKYYAQLKLLGSTIFKWRDKEGEYFRSVLSLNFNPLLNVGTRNSKTFAVNHGYSVAGINTEMKYRINTIDTADAIRGQWTIKVTASGYRILNEIKDLFGKDYYGQVEASVEYAITEKYGLSLGYKYGNDNAKYTTANVLEAGFKF